MALWHALARRGLEGEEESVSYHPIIGGGDETYPGLLLDQRRVYGSHLGAQVLVGYLRITPVDAPPTAADAQTGGSTPPLAAAPA